MIDEHDTYTVEYYSAVKGDLAIWSNINEAREYYASWNKSGRERQIPHYLIYMKILKNRTYKQIKTKVKTDIYRKNRWVPLGSWVKEMKVIKRYKSPVT